MRSPERRNKVMRSPDRRNKGLCDRRIDEIMTGQNHYNYRGLGGTVCVFLVFGTYRPTKTTIIIRGLGGAMCVFHVFGGHRPARATIIIGVWEARCVHFTCLEGIKPLRHQSRRGGFSVFFRGAENCPGRASNGRFGPPFFPG